MKAVIEFLQDLRNGWRAARRQRAMIQKAQAHEARMKRLKARIITVGEIQGIDPHSNALILGGGWSFDPQTPEGIVPVARVGLDGSFYFCGYTKEELLEIHAHRSEWGS